VVDFDACILLDTAYQPPLILTTQGTLSVLVPGAGVVVLRGMRSSLRPPEPKVVINAAYD
jgi:hypothetical protein